MAEVRLEAVNKKFDENVVLSDISFRAEDGEFVVLVGPSGCGKSTTLRLIAGLEEITSGSIYIGDSLVNDLPPKDRSIAMVFQDYALYPHMTVRENLEFGLRLRKVSKKEWDKRIQKASQMLNIEKLLERKPFQLSGGQRQRVAIGRAIVRKPGVFLFDEPLSNLDAKLREEMRIEIGQLHQGLGNTVLYVTHDQAEAMTLANRIIVMRDGVVHQVGKPLEVFRRPDNKFVAGFIGSPTMNFIKGEMTSGDGGLKFKALGFDIPLSGIKLRKNYKTPMDVTLGMRPHRLDFCESDDEKAMAKAEIGFVEHFGSHIIAVVQSEGRRLIMQKPPTAPLSSGKQIGLVFPVKNIHLFDEKEQAMVDKSV